MRAILLSCRRVTFLSSNKLGWFFFVKRTRPEKRGRFSDLRWRKNHSFCLWGEDILFSVDKEQVPLFSLEMRGPLSSPKWEGAILLFRGETGYSLISWMKGELRSALYNGQSHSLLFVDEPLSSLWIREGDSSLWREQGQIRDGDYLISGGERATLFSLTGIGQSQTLYIKGYVSLFSI